MMSLTRRFIALSLVLMFVTAVVAFGIELSVLAGHPHAAVTATKIADASRHSCVDINEGTFEWHWANVPFASTCDARPDLK